MVETEIKVYNVESMGPIVSLYSVKWLLTDLANRRIGGPALMDMLRTVERVVAEVSLEPTVRLAPRVPGGSVSPIIARIPHTFE